MTGPPPRPLIGVSMYRQVTRWWSWDRDAALVPGAYLDLVEAAGGQPVLIPPGSEELDTAAGRPVSGFEGLISVLDGLVLIGGGDLDASLYGQDPDPRNGGTNRQRDTVECGLLAGALDRDLPVLAICRGLQVLNVHLGGDLVQQLPDLLGSTGHQPRPGDFGANAVTTEPGSVVRRCYGARATVLCSHHQAIGELGAGLVVTARSDDGVIEAVEMPGRRFVVGVQWHPEEAGERRLFDELVDVARSPGGIEPKRKEAS